MGGQACNGGFANHPGIEMTGSENLVKGRVQHIETACQRAESWQDEAGCIFDKTPSPQHSTALAHTRAWVQMPRHLAAYECRGVARHWFVAKMQASIGADVEAVIRLTRQAGRGCRVVIAQHPNSSKLAREADKARRIRRRHALLPARIVKTVAQGHQKAGRVSLKTRLKSVQRFRRVIRRQSHPARGIGRTFFKMQISHDQRTCRRPVNRARHIADEPGAIDTKFCHLLIHPLAR